MQEAPYDEPEAQVPQRVTIDVRAGEKETLRKKLREMFPFLPPSEFEERCAEFEKDFVTLIGIHLKDGETSSHENIADYFSVNRSFLFKSLIAIYRARGSTAKEVRLAPGVRDYAKVAAEDIWEKQKKFLLDKFTPTGLSDTSKEFLNITSNKSHIAALAQWCSLLVSETQGRRAELQREYYARKRDRIPEGGRNDQPGPQREADSRKRDRVEDSGDEPPVPDIPQPKPNTKPSARSKKKAHVDPAQQPPTLPSVEQLEQLKLCQTTLQACLRQINAFGERCGKVKPNAEVESDVDDDEALLGLASQSNNKTKNNNKKDPPPAATAAKK
jgi:hypothetical protein